MSLVLALAKKPEVDVSAHIDVATTALWVGVACLALFFVLRPELWRRLWFERIDPRPAALMRISLGITVMWTFLDLLVLQGEWLFTDQGLLLTEMARKNYGGKLRTLWDPEHGVEHWYDWLKILTDRWTILFFRSDPPFVYTVFGLLFFCCFMMIIGAWTRIFTVLTLIFVWQIYNYNPIYFAGGDTVLRVNMFIAVFIDWGQAYSVDAWRKRRRAILKDGAKQLPALKRIAAWPKIFFMLQLACIYCATGLLKSGKTWADGSALYYALNLDHFYRFPAHYIAAWAHRLYITRAAAWIVHWWEISFPVLLVGEALRGWDRDVGKGIWQGPVPRWTLYSLIVALATLLVWNQPTHIKPIVLLVLAAILAVDRLWLAKADTSGTGWLSWTIRALSWAALLGFLVVAAYMADLSALYYFKPEKNTAAWLRNVPLRRQVAATVVMTVPLVLIGIVLAMRRWTPKAYLFVRDWLLGKRTWLVLGFLFHMGIEVSMNVGTFVQVMIAVYPVWLAGSDIDGMWKFVFWRAAEPGEGERPPWPDKLLPKIGRWIAVPYERMVYRVRKPAWTVVHGSAEMAIRRAALLRCWDLGQRLDFQLDPEAKGEGIRLVAPDGKTKVAGARDIGRVFILLFPGLWWLSPINWIPGVGQLAMKILRQRA